MAGLNPTIGQPPARRAASTAVSLPRLVMSWEDWLTFAAVLVAFCSIAITIQRAEWVPNMPQLLPTTVAALTVGLVAARVRVNGLLIQPFALVIGAIVVVAAVQNYADGMTLQDRLGDFWTRMREWWAIVRAGDISNDRLPFVLLVHSVTFLAAYFGAWAIYRWHNPWIALVPGGFILLSTISFMDGKPAGPLVFFLLGALFIVARSHLQKSQARWREEGVEYPDFLSLNALNVTFLVSVALLVLAWQVPIAKQAGFATSLIENMSRPFEPLNDRALRLFHTIDGGRSGNHHTFGDSLPIRGDISLGSRPLFEVNSGEPGFLRATSYDEYTGVGWKSTNRDDQRVPAGTQLNDTHQARTSTIVRVTVLDKESTVLTSGTGVGTNLDSIVDTAGGNAGDVERITSRRGLRDGDTYNAVGSRSVATAQQLREAGTAYPAEIADRYLQLPSNLPDRVGEEARRVAGGGATPYDQALMTQAYLRTFPYDESVPEAPPGRDVVDWLLFDLRRGYFDFQATAMAVMMRELGVPARVAVGYYLDPASAEDTRYTVRKSHAYAWTEVYFPGYGWVEFNPTSNRPPGGAGGTGTLPEQTTPLPINPGAEDPFGNIDDLLGGIDLIGAGEGGVGGALGEAPTLTDGPPWLLIWTMTTVVAMVAVGAVAARVTWNWGLGGLEGRARLWARTHRLAKWAGFPGQPSETPREWSRRLGTAIHREDDALLLADAYQETRYGRPDLQRIDDDEAAKAYRGLRGALLAKITRWKGFGGRSSGEEGGE